MGTLREEKTQKAPKSMLFKAGIDKRWEKYACKKSWHNSLWFCLQPTLKQGLRYDSEDATINKQTIQSVDKDTMP